MQPCICAGFPGALCLPEDSIADFSGNPKCREADVCLATIEKERTEWEEEHKKKR